MLRADLSASGYLPLCAVANWVVPSIVRMWTGVEKRTEIVERFDFRLTRRRNSDSLEKFAQNVTPLLSGPRKSRLDSSIMLSLAEAARNNREPAL